MTRKHFLSTAGAAVGAAAVPPLAAALPGAAAPAARPNASSTPKVPAPSVAARVVRAAEGTPYGVLGTAMTHKLTGADTYGQLMWLEDHNPPGAAIPLHVHTREDELFRVLEGRVEFTIGTEALTLGPGDVAFAPRYVPHAWRVVGEAPARTIMTAFPAGIEHMFGELAELPAGPPDLARVAQVCGRYGIYFV